MPTFSFNNQLEHVIGEMGMLTQKLNETLRVLDDGSRMRLNEWADEVREPYDRVKLEWDQAATRMTNNVLTAQGSLTVITEAYHAGQNYGRQLWDL
ncbi:hypothetical protein [Streptomyces coerulescens]|uniref:WXG100 family type VII secretion target n=1 Tax=Streptomyces coerulescens TaxID=29304 RepID=A0ABW0CUT3_STRCD